MLEYTISIHDTNLANVAFSKDKVLYKFTLGILREGLIYLSEQTAYILHLKVGKVSSLSENTVWNYYVVCVECSENEKVPCT